MSIFPRESIQGIAESIGLVLPDAVADALLQDTEYRLRDIIHESVKFMRHSKRKRLLCRDVGSALGVKNVEPVYGFLRGGPSNFKCTSVGSQQLYYLADKEYDLDELINMPLPPVPHQMTFTAHWLAVEGIQPRIPENPTPSDLVDKQVTATTSTVHRGGSIPLVKDVLTKELLIYYEKITETLMHSDSTVRHAAIEAVSSDPGLQNLLPYFTQFIIDTVTRNVKDVNTLWTMTRFIRALLHNPDNFIEPYLHQLLPNILTCVVSNRFTESGDHFALRLYAAQLLAFIHSEFGTRYPDLAQRMTKALTKGLLDPLKPLSTLFGALAGLSLLGKQITELIVMPNLMIASMRIEEERKKSGEDIDRVFELCVNVAVDHLKPIESKAALKKALKRFELGLFADQVAERLAKSLDQ